MKNEDKSFVKLFPDLSMRDSTIAGGKGASLGEMTRAGFPIPPGFVVLAEAFDRFLDEADLRQEIDAELAKCDKDKMHTIERGSERIQKMILSTKMPKDIASEIMSAYKTLSEKEKPPRNKNAASPHSHPLPFEDSGLPLRQGERGNDSENSPLGRGAESSRRGGVSSKVDEFSRRDDPPQEFFVAVRSSATAEDSKSAAWAGQLDSFLNTTEETLLENIQRCWASLFTPRAIFYRMEQLEGVGNRHACSLQGNKESETEHAHISVAVVVQTMIQSEISGIAFSVHPVTEDPDQLIIEAGYGLGEAIVSGTITPDSYVVSNIANQEKMLAHSSSTAHLPCPRGDVSSARQRGGREVSSPACPVVTRTTGRAEGVGVLAKKENGINRWIPVPASKQKKQKLTDAQILELSEIIIRIESHYGFPCDIEWAFANGKFFIVQSRPITTLSH